MKRFIILGAGKNKKLDVNPSYLHVNVNKTFLNWQIESSRILGCDRVDYVGGYQLDVSDSDLFSKVHLTLNIDWDKTNSLYSLLLLDFDPNCDLYISYNDVLLDDRFIKEKFVDLVSQNIIGLIDSSFPSRYQGDSHKCETIEFASKNSEFVGFMFIPKEHVKELVKLQKNITRYSNNSLSELIKILKEDGKKIELIDTFSNWCDANFPEDLPKFVLRGKAQALSNLKKIIKKSYFLDQISFSSFEWKENPEGIYNKTLTLIDSQQVAVRSSATNEDGFLQSNAGVYQSHLGINLKIYQEFSEAVNNTIKSYNNGHSKNDLVLIQPYIGNAYLHGIVFTKTHNGGPYYVFNYAYDCDTAAITGGYSSDFETFYFFRGADVKLLPKDLRAIYESIKEIEKILDYDSLDIEFLLTNNKKSYILQVRPQVSHKHESRVKDQEVIDILQKIKEKFIEENCSNTELFCNTKSIFAVMSDWNPAEIIGKKPLQLAYSLYEEIITNEIWAKQRCEFGYYDLGKYPLMKSFFGLPYIDVKASFLSFIPAAINHNLALKIVNNGLDHFRANPHLHDKVEFDVISTCYQFDFDEHYRHLFHDFDPSDYNLIKSHYKKLTADAICFDSKQTTFHPIEEAELTDGVSDIIKLTENAKKGALAFAHEARKAFVATILLKSLIRVNALTPQELENFYQSLGTISKMFCEDAYLCKIGKMKIEQFVKEYGHLRPGTYEITAPRYDSDIPTFISPIIEKAQPISTLDVIWSEGTIHKINNFLKDISIDLTFEEFIEFCRQSIVSREKVKFDFTKDISNILEKIASFGESLNINRQDIANFDFGFLKTIIKNKIFINRDKEIMNFIIKQNKKIYSLMRKVELPIVLFSERDVDAFYQPQCQPNFITSKKAMAELVVLTSNFKEDLKNKAVLIESADPGYEWIFSEDISVLITMYGGINSHMAVRAAELNIPSAIGIGEKKFKELTSGRFIMIDCQNKNLLSIE
jgi:choline kinase/phosphohistidine swiveling domain-containing protein